MDKRAWRRRIRAGHTELVIDLDRHIAALGRFLDDAIPAGLRIVVYDALPAEISLDALISAHAEPGDRFAMTRTPAEGRRLTLHPAGGATERHRYGYRQPTADSPVVTDDEVGAVLVPGLAFDRFGTRLGHGAGYYDRFLARLDPTVVRIGMAAGIVVERLPAEVNDVPMTHLATADAVTPVPLERIEAKDRFEPSEEPPGGALSSE